jgi:hypothetical protein
MKLISFVAIACAPVLAQYPASLLGNVGYTTVAGTEQDGDMGQNVNLAVGSNIYGPFEAGFSSMQDFILAQLGCETGKGYIDGGVDTALAEKVVAKDCGVELPRWEGNEYKSLLGTCGGHTRDYHFHERFSCLYSHAGSHSPQIGELVDGKFLYGMFEDADNKVLPQLDACGGHWGPTPDNDGDTYHYHVQTSAPFTVGCFGPNPDNSLVTVEQCRALYSTCDGVLSTYTTDDGATQYDNYCPCYDANGSNTGIDIAPLAVFSNPEVAKGPGGESVLQEPSSDTSSSSKMGSKKTSSMKKGSKMSSKSMGSKKQMGSGFRMAGGEGADDSCPMTAFEIRSGQFPNMCLDSSLKRGAFKKCSNNPAQKFFVSDGQIMKSDEPSTCMSATMTFGPCSKPHTFVRKGAKHQIKLGGAKCMTVMKNGRIAGKPCGKQKAKTFSFVPIFDAPAAPSGDANPFGSFRVGGDSEGEDENKKKKKDKKGGDANPFGTFRVGGGSEDEDENKKKKDKKGGDSNPFGSFRVGGGSEDGSPDGGDKKGKKKDKDNADNPFGTSGFRVGGGDSEDGEKKGT